MVNFTLFSKEFERIINEVVGIYGEWGFKIKKNKKKKVHNYFWRIEKSNKTQRNKIKKKANPK
jgi:vacuolar-type H+-ATPase subunit E/Vma4